MPTWTEPGLHSHMYHWITVVFKCTLTFFVGWFTFNLLQIAICSCYFYQWFKKQYQFIYQRKKLKDRHEYQPTVHPVTCTHKLSTYGWGRTCLVWFGMLTWHLVYILLTKNNKLNRPLKRVKNFRYYTDRFVWTGTCRPNPNNVVIILYLSWQP